MKVCDIAFKVSSGVAGAIVAGCIHVWKEHKVALITTVVVVSAVKCRHYSKKKRLRQKWNSAGENVVVLHGIPRAKTLPNLSPFVLKLETYLRMAGIKYVLDTEQPMGPKKKTPWITLNGQDYSDSELITEFLGKKFDKNFSSDLTHEQKAVARAMLIMNDEHILWGFAWWRMVKDPDRRVFALMELGLFVPAIVKPIIKRKVQKALWAQGLGRHSDAEIEEIVRKDIEALSLYLGKKPFIMGDSPCEVDCAIFGMIAQGVWGMPGSPFTSILNDHRNLLQYCIRMKEKFWPDWDRNLWVPK